MMPNLSVCKTLQYTASGSQGTHQMTLWITKTAKHSPQTVDFVLGMLGLKSCDIER